MDQEPSNKLVLTDTYIFNLFRYSDCLANKVDCTKFIICKVMSLFIQHCCIVWTVVLINKTSSHMLHLRAECIQFNLKTKSAQCIWSDPWFPRAAFICMNSICVNFDSKYIYDQCKTLSSCTILGQHLSYPVFVAAPERETMWLSVFSSSSNIYLIGTSPHILLTQYYQTHDGKRNISCFKHIKWIPFVIK